MPAGNRITVVLVVLAVFLAGWIGVLWTAPERVALPAPGRVVSDSPHVAFERTEIGHDDATAVRVTNIQVIDLDADGRNDLLVCDAARDHLLWYARTPDGDWKEHRIGGDLAAPAHATVADVDQDGDLDIVVSVLGVITPSDQLVGQVVLLEREGTSYRRRVLLDDVRRVADVQAGDLDGDGDVDLAVAVFGYVRGEVLWLENRGDLQFRDHQLLYRPGAIHVPVGDFDGDGDLDIATIVTQDEEELWAFENLGGGQFGRRRLDYTNNFDVGGAGLVACDLDRDGDLDLLLPQGDNLEDNYTRPQPYHGCKWFENLGGWKFRQHQIAHFGETYAAAVGDLDADEDLDIVLVSMSAATKDPTQPSIVWLENDGRQNFTMWRTATRPVNLATVACGDLNGDGRDDVVAGSLLMTATPRHDSARRITAWLSKEP